MAFKRDSGLIVLSTSGDAAPKQARTASGSTSWLDVGDARELVAHLQSDAGTGTTPTLDVKLQTSFDGNDATAIDVPASAFAQVGAAAASQIKSVAPFHRFVRITWAIGGTTPSFNFGVYLTAR
jgi:hypothetical protein